MLARFPESRHRLCFAFWYQGDHMQAGGVHKLHHASQTAAFCDSTTLGKLLWRADMVSQHLRPPRSPVGFDPEDGQVAANNFMLMPHVYLGILFTGLSRVCANLIDAAQTVVRVRSETIFRFNVGGGGGGNLGAKYQSITTRLCAEPRQGDTRPFGSTLSGAR